MIMSIHVASYPLRVLLLAAGCSCYLPACLDLMDSNDAGTGGTGNASGTLLAGTCVATFTACGGDVTGTWALQSICAESSLVDAVNALYRSGVDCGSVCQTASMTASGSVMYSGQTVNSSESFRFTESLGFGDACFTELKGTTLSDSTCQTGANDFHVPASDGTASCALSLATCACQVDQTTTDGASTYTLSGNNITEYNSTTLTQESIEYCITGTSMVQRRNLSPGVNFLVTFAKK